MIKTPKKFLSLINILIITCFMGLSAYIYRGFFFPDQVTLYLFPFAKTILVIIKILFPLLVFFLIFLYRLIYLRKVEYSSIVLLGFAVFFFLLLFYPIGDYFYRNSLTANIKEYHAYLQLNPPIIENYNSSKLNIFCLGGSTTEFVDETGRDWPGMVQKVLEKEEGYKKIELFNLGKQWYTTQHILINYLLNLKQYKPDVILVMENINDLLHNADFSWLSAGEFRDDYGNFLGPVTRMVKYQSFVGFLKNVLQNLWYKKDLTIVEDTDFRGILTFERNLKNLINLAKEDGTKIILMTQPNIYKNTMSAQEMEQLVMLNTEALGNGKRWTYQTALTGFQLYNNKIREIASSNEGVYLIDLELIVPKTLEYFIDDVHYNSNTHDLIAPYISKELVRILSLNN